MKYFIVLCFVLSIFGFGSCTKSFTGSKLSWMMTEKWLKTGGGHDNMDHGIYKRQDDIPDECDDAVSRLLCENGLYEQVVSLNLNCGRNNDAAQSAAMCDRNAAGEVCGIFDFPDTPLSAAEDRCLQGQTPDSCPSAECATSLEAVRNSPAGCCIASLFNQTSPLQVLDYTFWSQCGVETIEPCEETISRTPLSDATPCTDDEYIRQTLMLQCSGQFNGILDEVEDMEGCSQIRKVYASLCQVNSQGENCNLVDSDIRPALNECNITEASCSDGCREALETFRSEQGCCFNFIYNNTEIDNSIPEEEMALASYTLWNQCGVDTPPLTCRNLLSKAHSKDLTIFTLVLTLLVAMWNN